MKARLAGPLTLEELSEHLQHALAHLQNSGAEGVRSCTLYLTATDAAGREIQLPDFAVDRHEIERRTLDSPRIRTLESDPQGHSARRGSQPAPRNRPTKAI